MVVATCRFIYLLHMFKSVLAFTGEISRIPDTLSQPSPKCVCDCLSRLHISPTKPEGLTCWGDKEMDWLRLMGGQWNRSMIWYRSNDFCQQHQWDNVSTFTTSFKEGEKKRGQSGEYFCRLKKILDSEQKPSSDNKKKTICPFLRCAIHARIFFSSWLNNIIYTFFHILYV